MLLSFAVVTDEACSLPSLTDNTKCSDRDEIYRCRHKTPDVKILMAVCRDLDENCCDYMAESMKNYEYEEQGKRRNMINEHMCIWCGKHRDRRALH